MSAEGPNVQRRLAAVLAADVVGYSRLMEVDEAGTLARLKTVRLELIDPAITKCKGRIIKTTGDGMLVEFQSVTEALRCAVDFQERMARRNRDMAGVARVALSHRHQSSATSSSRTTISSATASTSPRGSKGWRSRAASAFPPRCAIRSATGSRSATQDLGEQQVKNISRPIRAYKVVLERSSQRAGPASPARQAAPQVSVRKPSIAVLPFVNMSGDPEQEFFVDGLTEDIITELSRFRELLVISRNAVFVHKGKPVKAQQVAREFGVDYIVEGSVRKAGGSGQGDGPAHRRRNRDASLGRALRSQARGHFRHPGRNHRRRSLRPCSAGSRPRGTTASKRKTDGEHGGVRVCAGRQGPASLVESRSQRRGASARSTAPSSSTRTMPTPMPGWLA